MEDYWNPQRLHQFVIELESIASIMYLFRKQLEAITESEVEKSRVREIVSGYRAAYIPRFEKVKKMREEASGSSGNGRNEEQEFTENAKNCSKNRDEEQEHYYSLLSSPNLQLSLPLITRFFKLGLIQKFILFADGGAIQSGCMFIGEDTFNDFPLSATTVALPPPPTPIRLDDFIHPSKIMHQMPTKN